MKAKQGKKNKNKQELQHCLLFINFLEYNVIYLFITKFAMIIKRTNFSLFFS